MKNFYHEIQYFPWWVYLVLAVGAVPIVWAVLRGAFSPTLGLGAGSVLLLITMLPLRMTTLMNEQSLIVSFGWVPVVTKTIPLSEIIDAEICSYRPLAQFGGWGWRYGFDGTHALTATGDQGLCLHLQDGRRVLVGSSKSQELAHMIHETLHAPSTHPESQAQSKDDSART